LTGREPIAIQYALVGLQLLRRTDFFFGTVVSSFSGLAAFGRSVPVMLRQSGHPLQRLIPMLYRLRGYRSLIWLAHYYWSVIRFLGASKSNI
jgi:hypothetical protein